MSKSHSKRAAAGPTDPPSNRCVSRFTGPLHVQVGDTHITIHPGGVVTVTPALRAALGELVHGLEPVKGPGPTEIAPSDGPTEEA